MQPFPSSAALVLLAASTALGQTPGGGYTRSIQLARLVPPDVGLFIELDPPDQIEPRLGAVPRAMIGSWLGAAPPSGGLCVAALAAHVGLPSNGQYASVFGGGVALAAADWADFGDAVVVVEVRDTAAFDRALGIDRKAPVPVHDGPRIAQTPSGLSVALGKRWAALSRRPVDDSPLFSSIAERLTNAQGHSLATRREFRALWGQLPRDALARIFVDQPRSGAAADLLLRNVDRCAIGLTLRPEAAELHVRADIAPQLKPAPPQPVAVSRVLDLPQSTLVAWATYIQPAELLTGQPTPESGGLAATLTGLTARLLGGDPTPSWLGGLGPRVVLAWGRAHVSPSSVPQLAILIEASSATESAAALAAAAESWVPALSAMQASDGELPVTIQHEDYLGAELWSIPIGALIAPSDGTSGPLDWLTSVAPSLAGIDDWLIIALTPDYLKQIIDAARGVIPTLRTVPDVPRIDTAAPDRIVYARSQPGLVAQVLRDWLDDHANGRASILDRDWWGGADAGGSPQVGIGIDRRFEPGRVVVARIHAGLPADGRLLVGDRILGVDGRVLSLAAPNDDFRRQIRTPAEQNTRTLRVLRGDELLDVELALAPAKAPAADPLEALRRIAGLMAQVRDASYSVAVTGDHHMSARLTLVFVR